MSPSTTTAAGVRLPSPSFDAKVDTGDDIDKVEWDGEFGQREIGGLEDLSVPPRCRIYLPIDISLLQRIYIYQTGSVMATPHTIVH